MCYLAAALSCGVFYIAYGEWFSWLVLLIVLGLPWLSLLLSLPAIFGFRVDAEGPAFVQMGGEGEIWLLGSSRLPLPPFKGKLRLQHCITGESRRYQVLRGLPTEHCGGIRVTVEKARVCDYLGLFSFPVRQKGAKTILIRPVPVPVPEPPDPKHYIAKVWRPKFGGGFAENHELRLYHPGDSLNQIHWKLSAKTGSLTLREPMEPQRGLVLLTMTLRGTPEELDRKFGRLLWMGNYLLEQNVPFEIRALTADGVRSLPVTDARELNKAIDTLLCAQAAKEGSIRDRAYAASWQYHIGGDADEI
ncbi:MAG: DUF58 domain-containing protein [Faecousia sp.]